MLGPYLSMRSFSVLVPVYNEEENIERLLVSIYAQDLAPSRVIVFDDGSTDSTPKILERLSKDLGFEVRRTRGIGKPSILNLAFRELDTSYVVVVDSDVILPRRFFRDLFVCGGGSDLIYSWYITISRGAIGSMYRFFSLAFDGDTRVGGLYKAPGCCFAISRNIYKRLYIPPGVERDDAYMYLYSKYILKAKVRFCRCTKVYLVDRKVDLKLAARRYSRSKAPIKGVDPYYVKMESWVDWLWLVRRLFEVGKKDPLGFLSYISLRPILKLYRLLGGLSIEERWRP